MKLHYVYFYKKAKLHICSTEEIFSTDVQRVPKRMCACKFVPLLVMPINLSWCFCNKGWGNKITNFVLLHSNTAHVMTIVQKGWTNIKCVWRLESEHLSRITVVYEWILLNKNASFLEHYWIFLQKFVIRYPLCAWNGLRPFVFKNEDNCPRLWGQLLLY